MEWTSIKWTRTAAVLAGVGLAVVGQFSVGAPANAMTLGTTVQAGATDSAVSWQVPAVATSAVSVANSSGAAQASTVLTLRNHRAPTAYTFPVHLPAGATMTLQGDGSIAVSRNGGPIGSFQAPWAKDARGRVLATHYLINGGSIVQQIDTAGAVFPVTADPKYTTGWVTGTVYFKKSETRTIASSVTYAVVLCGAAAALVGGPVFGAACGVSAVQMNSQARTATSRGQCIKLKIALYPSPTYVGTYIYSGGYCT